MLNDFTIHFLLPLSLCARVEEPPLILITCPETGIQWRDQGDFILRALRSSDFTQVKFKEEKLIFPQMMQRSSTNRQTKGKSKSLFYSITHREQLCTKHDFKCFICSLKMVDRYKEFTVYWWLGHKKANLWTQRR